MTTTFPLDLSINRCLAHGFLPGESCPKADECARHVTIRHDLSPVPAGYRVCPTVEMKGFVPIEVTVAQTEVPATTLHPMGSLGEPVESEGGEL